MDDDEQGLNQRRLRRYQPVGPPAGLRARVVAEDRRSTAGLLIWLPAAFTAAAAMTLIVLGWSARRELASEFPNEDADRTALVTAVAAELGGDPEARALIARLIELDEREGGLDRATAAPEGSRHE